MKTNVMQIVRLVMMIVAVAGIIYALEYMERGIAVWFWITLLGVGFVGLLYTFRLTQRRVRLERRARERQEKKNPAGRNADLHPPDIVARRFGFRAEACGFRWGGFPGAAVLFRKSGLVSCRWISLSWQTASPWAAWSSCLGWMSNASAPKSASGSQAAAGAGHDDGGRPAGRGVANTPVIRIFAAAYATNSASQRVLVKTGFRHVGTFRKAFFKNGAFVDGCYYELLKDENE